MISRIAVRDLRFGCLAEMKKEALYFDKFVFDYNSYKINMAIVYDSLNQISKQKNINVDLKAIFGEAEAEIQFLWDNGVIVPSGLKENISEFFNVETDQNTVKLSTKTAPSNDIDDISQGELVALMADELNNLIMLGEENNLIKMRDTENFDDFLLRVNSENARRVKLISILRNWLDASALHVPILSEKYLVGQDKFLKEQQATKLVINRFPQPTDSVPWEKILDFRADPENRAKLISLRRWISEIGTLDKNFREIEEEIDFLLHEYTRLMKLHKIKYDYGILEIAVTTTLETIERLVKFEWSKAVRQVFAVKRQNTDFLIAAESLVGKELAYLYSANSQFSDNNPI